MIYMLPFPILEYEAVTFPLYVKKIVIVPK